MGVYIEDEEIYGKEKVEAAQLCYGMSHPARWLILEILKDKKKIAISDLLIILQSEYDYRQNYSRLKHHLTRMEEAGIVKIHDYRSRRKPMDCLLYTSPSPRD